MQKLHNLLSRIFGAAEEINGHDRCPTYLYRWIVFKRWGRGIYLHHFVADDWSRDLHDHPRRFISIGLWGWYQEEALTPDCGLKYTTTYRAPWLRSFPATHIHRLLVPTKNCWTLVIVLKSTRPWGFWHDERFIYWRDYIMGKDKAIGDAMIGCDQEEKEV